MDLAAPVQFVKGVGPQRATALRDAGIASAEDLLYHIPLRYEDRRSFARIADLRPGMRVSVSGTVAVAGLRRARRMTLYEVRLEDDTGRLKALWFNQPFLKDVLPRGTRVVLFGTVVMTMGTLPFAFVGTHTSDPLLVAALVVRGIGLGSTIQPAIAGALAMLSSAEVPRATAALNAIQRTGGALGAALLAVVLEHQLAMASSGSSAAGSAALDSISGAANSDVVTAFGNSFWWAVGLSVLAIVPAAILVRTQRHDRRRAPGTASGAANPAGATT